MQFKEKNAPACTETYEQYKLTINNNILALKNLWLKLELHNSLLDKAQNWPILTLWPQITNSYYLLLIKIGISKNIS